MEKSNNNPFISIVIPTRDRAHLLKKVLYYISKQTFSNFEVIIADNSVIRPCLDDINPFLNDPRFQYHRSPSDLSMCDNWEFAVSFAKGHYVTVVSEKFIFRPDALVTIFNAAQNKDEPDIISWSYEPFDVLGEEGDELYGTYHPLIKPDLLTDYDPGAILADKLSFSHPIFSRYNRTIDNYGKIYSGCVKRCILAKIKKQQGYIFYPLILDFTSMTLFLNEAKTCCDISQSLMLTIANTEHSTGVVTRLSLPQRIAFLETYYVDLTQYQESCLTKGVWIGHHAAVARDIHLLQQDVKSGPLAACNLDAQAVLFWAREDVKQVTDWGDFDKDAYLQFIDRLVADIDSDKRNLLQSNLLKSRQPSPKEIYHSGLEKSAIPVINCSAEELAILHWQKQIAPPRKNITDVNVSLDKAVSFFYLYNQYSCDLLDVN